MDTFREMIAALGGPTRVAQALGVTVGAVCNMSRRRTIMPDHWAGLISMAQERGTDGITLETIYSTFVAERTRAHWEAWSSGGEHTAPEAQGSEPDHIEPSVSSQR